MVSADTQYVVFNLNNVIIDIDMTFFWQLIDELGVCKKDMDRYINLIKKQELCGLVDIYDVLEDEFYMYEAQELTQAWLSGIKVNEQVLNFIKNLQFEGFQIAYMANIGNTRLNYLRHNFDFMKLSSVQHMSCEVGVIKPSLLFYQSFLMNNERFAGSILIDNCLHTSAAECNFKTIEFSLSNYKDKPSFHLKKDLNEIKNKLLCS